ncbi:MAG: vancomycin high temperature exclusion protein [Candidatus Fimenecus sp.]
MQTRRRLKQFFLVCCAVILLGTLCLGTINAIVILKSKPFILEQSEATDLNNVDCILVLGCAVWNNQTLSPMLEDRVKTGLSLLESDTCDRLLMSGDHGTENYDEVNHMKQYCVDKGVDPDIIFLDHAGFSTYESMYRAKAIFGVKKMIVVTQGYHLYRAVYIARALGIEAYGVAADLQEYALGTDIKNNLREALARVKDFGTCFVKPQPTYLGEAIPIDGSAKLSDDKEYV